MDGQSPPSLASWGLVHGFINEWGSLYASYGRNNEGPLESGCNISVGSWYEGREEKANWVGHLFGHLFDLLLERGVEESTNVSDNLLLLRVRHRRGECRRQLRKSWTLALQRDGRLGSIEKEADYNMASCESGGMNSTCAMFIALCEHVE